MQLDETQRNTVRQSLAAGWHEGFEPSMFAEQLESVRRVTPLDVGRYGISAEHLEAIKARCMQWAAHIRVRSDGAEVEFLRLAEPRHGPQPVLCACRNARPWQDGHSLPTRSAWRRGSQDAPNKLTRDRARVRGSSLPVSQDVAGLLALGGAEKPGPQPRSSSRAPG